jgi:hypothetical protein
MPNSFQNRVWTVMAHLLLWLRTLVCLGRSRLSITRQIICETNPGQSVLNPSMVGWRHFIGPVEAANGNIHLFSVRFGHEGQWGAAARTERAHSACPPHLVRLSRGEPKVVPAEGCPRHERCATASPTIQTVAMCNIVGLSVRLVAY